jgi:hypothetical protein
LSGRAPRFADLLELSLDEKAALDGFETLSSNGRPLGARDFIAMVEMKLGRKARPGKRGESRAQGGRIDMGNSYHVPVMPSWSRIGRYSQVGSSHHGRERLGVTLDEMFTVIFQEGLVV